MPKKVQPSDVKRTDEPELILYCPTCHSCRSVFSMSEFSHITWAESHSKPCDQTLEIYSDKHVNAKGSLQEGLKKIEQQTDGFR